MRVLDIIKPLFEFAPPSTGEGTADLIRTLLSMVLNNTLEGPARHQAIDVLARIEQKAEELDSQEEPAQQPAPVQAQPQQPAPVQAQPQQPAPVEAPPEEQPISEATARLNYKTLIGNLIKRLADPVETEKLVTASRAEGVPDSFIYKLINQGQKIEFVDNQAAFSAVADLAYQLANKVSGILNELKKAADIQVALGKANPEVRRPKVPKPKKTLPAKKELINLLTDTFSRPLAGATSIDDRDERADRITEFMTRCITGVIKFEDLLDAKRGNVLSLLTDPDDQKIVEIIGNLLLIKPSATAGNWGPGELGLAILGDPVTKSNDKGDLDINGRLIELKASQNPEKGGRLGTQALEKGLAGLPKYYEALQTLLSSAYGKNIPFDFSLKKASKKSQESEELAEARKQTSRKLQLKHTAVLPANNLGVYTTSEGKQKDIKWTSFGRTFVNHSLNPKIKNKVGSDTTKDFLRSVALSCLNPLFSELYDTDFVNNCVNKDGTIKYETFTAGYTKMLYQIYQIKDKVGEIMVLNPNSGSYYVLSGPDDIDNAIQTDPTGEFQNVQIGSVCIDFTDSQGKASPQIGIA
jgi:hypothetical protein